MLYRLIEKTEDAQEITEAAYSEWYDVGGFGCDSISFCCVATDDSSPVDATIQIEGSNDMSAVVNVGSPVAITADGNYLAEKDRPAFRYYRIAYAITSGSYVSTLEVLGKGDRAG